jgi:hypothetical protein
MGIWQALGWGPKESKKKMKLQLIYVAKRHDFAGTWSGL